jgi:hypothetical protein
LKANCCSIPLHQIHLMCWVESISNTIFFILAIACSVWFFFVCCFPTWLTCSFHLIGISPVIVWAVWCYIDSVFYTFIMYSKATNCHYHDLYFYPILSIDNNLFLPKHQLINGVVFVFGFYWDIAFM